MNTGAGLVPHQSRRRCRPQARRFNPASLLFGFGWRGKLLILAFRLTPFRCRRWGRPCKSGGPPLFALSLNVQRDTHKRQRARCSKVPRGSSLGLGPALCFYCGLMGYPRMPFSGDANLYSGQYPLSSCRGLDILSLLWKPFRLSL
jgi:hypothetical protein